eukprot:g6484.t1
MRASGLSFRGRSLLEDAFAVAAPTNISTRLRQQQSSFLSSDADDDEWELEIMDDAYGAGGGGGDDDCDGDGDWWEASLAKKERELRAQESAINERMLLHQAAMAEERERLAAVTRAQEAELEGRRPGLNIISTFGGGTAAFCHHHAKDDGLSARQLAKRKRHEEEVKARSEKRFRRQNWRENHESLPAGKWTLAPRTEPIYRYRSRRIYGMDGNVVMTTGQYDIDFMLRDMPFLRPRKGQDINLDKVTNVYYRIRTVLRKVLEDLATDLDIQDSDWVSMAVHARDMPTATGVPGNMRWDERETRMLPLLLQRIWEAVNSDQPFTLDSDTTFHFDLVRNIEGGCSRLPDGVAAFLPRGLYPVVTDDRDCGPMALVLGLALGLKKQGPMTAEEIAAEGLRDFANGLMGQFERLRKDPATNKTLAAELCRSWRTPRRPYELRIYGGTGKIPGSRYNKPGFIAVPPCLWGKAEHGLAAPPDLDGITLHVVKTSNATCGHHGEMAHPQVYYV